MNKLLAANFSRMFKDKVFWIGTIFMAAICILTAFLLLLGGAFIQAKLKSRKHMTVIFLRMKQDKIETEEAQPNPNYISGTKRKVYEFLMSFFPVVSLLKLRIIPLKNHGCLCCIPV